ncbi:S-layer homology domain-containing protein [Plectonema cf. radiosum LEGE 06105]|uniref:S-layer homology domain-containing protein n=1 Tax=Plectonema cf. radiosum LEGE 06105 TaxID=945769 RepID=A0A8J7K4U0_9CYAN|nr:S-layer homology domain-containing protein [Plectonema radiosum]MBE9216502.1 S-layer homology domain-containing protein [Plectonema cf. radiosum LEGE 06105]
MLHCKYPGVLLSFAVFLSTLTACANTPFAKNIEQSLQADPRLTENPVIFGAKQVNDSQKQPTTSLPADFPEDIPIYPNAELQSVTPTNDNTGKLSARWLSSDPSNFIVDFYRQEFRSNQWEVIQQPEDGQQGEFTAQRNNSELKVSVEPKTVANTQPNQPQTSSELIIEYSPSTTTQTTPTPNPSITNNPDFIGPVQPGDTIIQSELPQTVIESQEFDDLNKAPQELQPYIQDLAALGVLSVPANAVKTNSATNEFQPNANITRRQYARWLVAANNAMYSNSPSKQIRLAVEGNKSAFSDVPKTDPDFAAIQGLAEAGLIPSALSGDSTQVLFRPDAPLTREQLLLWKVPLDNRQGLPNASLDAVKQTWGFQDAAKIDPKALRAVLADYQNGEQSNIRRVFGYTTLLQPKKAVTRAEAAAALWYFGTENEGVSAKEALKLKQ